MPTFSKLVAGLLFAALAWWASGVIRPDLPDTFPKGLMREGNTLLAAILGWRLTGGGVGRGYASSAGIGISTGIAITLSAMFLWAFYIMIRRSMQLVYEGPSEALKAWIALVVEIAAALWENPLLLVAILLASALVGLAAELVRERRRG